MRLLSGRFARLAEARRDQGRKDGKKDLREEEVDADGGDHGHIWEVGIGS